MKLIIPLILILLGILTGYVVRRLLPWSNKLSVIPLLAGGCGAFAGILVRDWLDVGTENALLSTLLAAVLGAAICAAISSVIQVNKHS